ncbi:MarR family winged helix-turn-helix transcriptional regulator [Kitasatospora purpeofusca]|uniref:MarR family winged helix-turn-helix transcriptional regulator n=1 Tax=Kitasatospora purpeofusca TaxID=67352 RepID=UPI0022539772|nr:MarR family transcriptional regulator [Kitasatospora purpeofusca]MCX4690342.1 MarR family winged helix-turn-helix transcriptional regulator [Kitasatospora purpeofusca]
MTNRTPGAQRASGAGAPGRPARPRGSAAPAGCAHVGQEGQEGQEAPAGLLARSSFLMALVGRAARRLLAEEAAARGLKLWHVMVLCALGDTPGLSKAELAERLGLSSADVARVVGDLVAAGHVTCARDEADRRRTLTRLTRRGREVAAAVDGELAAVDDDVLAPLSVADRERLADILALLSEHLDAEHFGLRPVRRRPAPRA